MRLIHVLEMGEQYNYWYILPGIAISRNNEVRGIAIFWLRWILWININKNKGV